MGGPQRHTLFASALALAVLLLHANNVAAVRIGFMSDSGIGNDNPRDHGPLYEVDRQPCYDYKGAPCLLLSHARDVISALRDNGVDLVVHAGDMDYESSPKMWRHFVDETILSQGRDFLASKGNHDADGYGGLPWPWSGSDGYAAQLKSTAPTGCEGTYGEDMVCNYKGFRPY